MAKTLIGLDIVSSLYIPNHSPSQYLRVGWFGSLIQHSNKLLISHCQQLYSFFSKGNKNFNSSQEWKSLDSTLHRSQKVRRLDLYNSWVLGMDNPNSNPLKLKPHHMLIRFVYGFSCLQWGEVQLFNHFFLSLWDLPPYIWSQRWTVVFDQSPIHFGAPFHVLRGLAHC